MLPIVWRASAQKNLAHIIRYIAERDPQAARNMRQRIEESVLPTADHPYLFRAGRVPGTREIVAHPNYIVVYRVALDAIEVVQVVHARQKFP